MLTHGEKLNGNWFGGLFLSSFVSLCMPCEMAGRMFGRTVECYWFRVFRFRAPESCVPPYF